MKEIRINKAQPVIPVKPIPSVTIVIEDEIPECESMQRWQHETNTQGIVLANALSGTLPGAVLDAMLVELLRRKQSILSVPAFVE